MQESRNTSHETILERIQALTCAPVAVEALWDGDSGGWFIVLNAITGDGRVHYLGTLSDGGDLRLFDGHIPPWPETLAASRIGHELAAKYGAEFYFPSPNYPEEQCPSWNDRAQGYPCRRCGILLQQSSPCPWRGVCYHCHMAEEREQREAQWTPEQRAGLRCFMCGNPATAEVRGYPTCTACMDKYEFFNCEKCNIQVTRIKKISERKWCTDCQAQQAIEALTDSQLSLIREALTEGQFEARRKVAEILDCSFSEANSIVRVLMRQQNNME